MSFSRTVNDINWQLDGQLLPHFFSFLPQSRTELIRARNLRKIHAHIGEWYFLIAFLADASTSNTSFLIRPFLLYVLSRSWTLRSTDVGVAPRFRTGLWSTNMSYRTAHPPTRTHIHTFAYIVGLHKINLWISQLTDSKFPFFFFPAWISLRNYPLWNLCVIQAIRWNLWRALCLMTYVKPDWRDLCPRKNIVGCCFLRTKYTRRISSQ